MARMVDKRELYRSMRFQAGTSPAEAGVPEPVYVRAVEGDVCVERNVAIPLADGTLIHVDLFRPLTDDVVPTLIAWGPYGKHNGGNVYAEFQDEAGVKGAGVDPTWISPYTTFEGPDPKRWCAAGYAVMNVDPRGTWWSGGDFASLWDEREARDAGHVIGWAADREWSNGKVGMTGVSYLAVAQWWAASLQPAGLAAINPCEGVTDVYREFAFHGGIPSHFPSFWQRNRLKYSRSKIEAMADMMDEHAFLDEYWLSKRPDLANVEVPAFVIASWSDQGLHTRGTLEGFDAISSEHKFLEVHGRKKWAYYHHPETVERTRRFFDRFLKDIDNGVEDDWPRIRLETRLRAYDGTVRTPTAWPPEEATTRELHLDAATRRLVDAPPGIQATARYDARPGGDELAFDLVFDEPTDVIGGMRLHVWVATTEGDDLDLFVAVKKLGADGEVVDFPFANVLERGPVALGWLRVSHRELDLGRSTPTRPWHPHTREDRVAPGEAVAADVEIWPSLTRFEAGEGLRLVLRGSDFYTGAVMSRHVDTRNAGDHVIHTGERWDSTLTFSVLAPTSDAPAWT
jgi:predicted acyl esterase